MNVISFENVRKAFDGTPVLDGISFDVEKGEVLAIVGPSGTGKSVLLKHIVGLLAPDSGEVTVDSEARVGYLFQSGALLAWQTVAENVALPLEETTSLDAAAIDARVAMALDAVGLADAADKYPAEISGGMQKRAGLARAIVCDADVILYDEPTSGLDPVTTARIHALIRRLNRERGITSVVVTHDLNAILKIADRILLVAKGKVVECLKPAEFLRASNPLVREFLAAAKGDI